jgi:hypothetical protein
MSRHRRQQLRLVELKASLSSSFSVRPAASAPGSPDGVPAKFKDRRGRPFESAPCVVGDENQASLRGGRFKS